MNKHQFNVEIQYSQHTHSHQKHRHFLQLLFISFGVCVCVFFLFNSYHLTNMCPKCDATTNSMGYSFFFLKKGNVIIRKCIEFVNKKGWT